MHGTLAAMGALEVTRLHNDAMPVVSGIVLVVQGASGKFETPIEDWLLRGPGACETARPVAARLAPSGHALPLHCIVPLRYRNTTLSRLLIALRVLPNPWKLPPA